MLAGGGRILGGCVGCPQLFERCGAKKRMKQLKQCAAHGIRFLQVCAYGVGVAAGAAYAQEVAPAASWDVTAAGRGIARVSFIGTVPLFQVNWCNTARGDLQGVAANGNKEVYPAFGVSFGYEYFVYRGLSLGIDASAQHYCSYPYNNVNQLCSYIAVPIALTAGYTLAFWRIRLPLTVGAGFNYQHYNTSTYCGLLLKAGAGCYVQLTERWSVGASAAYSGVPRACEKVFERNDKQTNTRTAQFVTAGVDIRYHL
ncbi:hypothetical protein TPCCA_0133b [Treponema paraluiscuniculi Cuniculi A]|uniref:Outer membrane protein beta-barrel domain-containing protein n=3 Tax=Treponema paraluiscuniculi TaxID=53435 RepID=F7XRX5_TREPU|nr:hypothetical protein TPCCA_0133b [Treponema paraluiscuniculi Cuniculi A]